MSLMSLRKEEKEKLTVNRIECKYQEHGMLVLYESCSVHTMLEIFYNSRDEN